jgi:hypothetical protein
LISIYLADVEERLTSLGAGWGDNAYTRPFDPDFIHRIVDFAREISQVLYTDTVKRGIDRFGFPSIGPCENNSLDLYWHTPHYVPFVSKSGFKSYLSRRVFN